MAKFVPVSRQHHSSRSWIRPVNYDFAARDAFCPLAGLEIAAAATSYPIAFMKVAEAYQPIAVLAQSAGTNLYLAPNGTWVPGRYVPSLIRVYPFRLLSAEDKSSMVLCVDESSGLVQDGNNGEPFFHPDGQVAPALANIARLLEAAARSRLSLEPALASLAAAGLMVPWEQADAPEPSKGGLYRIDERRLRSLDDASFGALRHNNALPLAYAQLLSMSNLDMLAQLAVARTRAGEAASGDTLNQMFGGQVEQVLRFD